MLPWLMLQRERGRVAIRTLLLTGSRVMPNSSVTRYSRLQHAGREVLVPGVGERVEAVHHHQMADRLVVGRVIAPVLEQAVVGIDPERKEEPIAEEDVPSSGAGPRLEHDRIRRESKHR